jgi:hypothetical protein
MSYIQKEKEDNKNLLHVTTFSVVIFMITVSDLVICQNLLCCLIFLSFHSFCNYFLYILVNRKWIFAASLCWRTWLSVGRSSHSSRVYILSETGRYTTVMLLRPWCELRVFHFCMCTGCCVSLFAVEIMLFKTVMLKWTTFCPVCFRG